MLKQMKCEFCGKELVLSPYEKRNRQKTTYRRFCGTTCRNRGRRVVDDYDTPTSANFVCTAVTLTEGQLAWLDLQTLTLKTRSRKGLRSYVVRKLIRDAMSKDSVAKLIDRLQA